MPLYNGADEVLELYSGADQVMALYNGADSLLASPYAMHTVSLLGYFAGPPAEGPITPTTFRGLTITGVMWYGALRVSMSGAETETAWSKFTLINSAGTVVVDEMRLSFVFSYTSGINYWTLAMGTSPFPAGAADWKVYFHE